MQTLFNLVSPIQQGIVHLPEWQYVRDGLKKNLKMVISFHRKNPMAVESSHFLVRLLQSITVPQSLNIERYYDNVDTISLNVSMALKMTSSISNGQMFDGVFYGKGNPEILIAHNENFDPIEATKNWENLSPVRVLRHSLSDLGLNVPDGKINGSETGLAVIGINIPMLAVQYRAFRFNEIAVSEGEDGSQRSIMEFIRMYVLPNMLFSHLDHALFNRIDNLQKGAPLGESKRQHSFLLLDYTDRVNAVHVSILRNLDTISKDFMGILQSVPCVSKSNANELMKLPNIAPTRQVVWALVIARLPSLLFMFSVSKDGPGTKNRSEVNRVLRYITSYKSDNLMKTMLPRDVIDDVQFDIQQVINKA